MNKVNANYLIKMLFILLKIYLLNIILQKKKKETVKIQNVNKILKFNAQIKVNDFIRTFNVIYEYNTIRLPRHH